MIGEEAAKIIIAKINNEENVKEQIMFEPEFIIRRSTE
jgi:DNA-binding LacI/PurR family transcriptional regulator